MNSCEIRGDQSALTLSPLAGSRGEGTGIGGPRPCAPSPQSLRPPWPLCPRQPVGLVACPGQVGLRPTGCCYFFGLPFITTRTGLIFQMSSQYSRMARSDENLPMRAVLRIDMRVHCLVFLYAADT